MRALLPVAGLLALAACDRPAPKAPPAAGAPTTDSRWAFGLGKASAEMAWLKAPDRPEAGLRLICARGGGMMVEVAAFSPVASEERLSIGAGGQAVALVARSVEGQPVRATGPVDDALLAVVAGGGAISARYGAQTFGPVEAPPAALRRAFADLCRDMNPARGEAA
ncbi:MAG: hypothetical protein ACOY4K_11575 [Pseudomonadota bacterium]